MTRSETTAVLREAAFGATPGKAPLPSAPDERSRWHRAVALGGQGRYAAGRSQLEQLTRSENPITRSLAWSTHASWLRQMGKHRAATRFDGAAWAAVGSDDPDRPADPASVGARCDALAGLAADALGERRLRFSRDVLDRCHAELCRPLTGEPDVLWRHMIRVQWVEAELAMCHGDGRGAMLHARTAEEFARQCSSVRHRVKSAVVLAAALLTSGDAAGAASAVATAAGSSAQHKLVPLIWASSMLEIALGDDGRAEDTRAACERVLHHRGS